MENCSYPLTGAGVVNRIFTDLAVIDVTENGLMVREKLADITLAELQQKTAAVLQESEVCRKLQAPIL